MGGFGVSIATGGPLAAKQTSPLVPKLCLGTPAARASASRPAEEPDAKRSFADVRSQAELGNERNGRVRRVNCNGWAARRKANLTSGPAADYKPPPRVPRRSAHVRVASRRLAHLSRLGVSSAGGGADPRLGRPARRLPGPRLPARPVAGRGPLLGLVAPPRLELLQQGAARGLPHPGRLCDRRRLVGAAHRRPRLRRAPAGRRLRRVAPAEPLRPGRAGLPARDAGARRRGAGTDAAGDGGGGVAHDHRRPVHLLLGLGAGPRPPGVLPRLAVGVAGGGGGRRPGNPGEIHDGAVAAVGRSVPADRPRPPPPAGAARLLDHERHGGFLLSSYPHLEHAARLGHVPPRRSPGRRRVPLAGAAGLRRRPGRPADGLLVRGLAGRDGGASADAANPTPA